jgi:eukaryotic-like serine/threonine-protein kinase
MDMPEWKIAGYTELRALGSGGFGDVVLARHDPSGAMVAIKYLHHDLLADAQFAAMFRGEAAVLAALDDPNVVRLYEYIESPGGSAIVMERLPRSHEGRLGQGPGRSCRDGKEPVEITGRSEGTA